MNIEESEMAPGYCGLLFDDTPLLTQAHVRAFVWPILLYRGAVRPHEVVGAISQVCSTEDLKTGAWSALEGDYSDRSRVEILVGTSRPKLKTSYSSHPKHEAGTAAFVHWAIRRDHQIGL